MKLLCTIWEWWCSLWRCNWHLPRIDTHKWHNKSEIHRRLKYRYF